MTNPLPQQDLEGQREIQTPRGWSVITRGFVIEEPLVSAFMIMLSYLVKRFFPDAPQGVIYIENQARLEKTLGTKEGVMATILKTGLLYHQLPPSEQQLFYGPEISPGVRDVYHRFDNLKPSFTGLREALLSRHTQAPTPTPTPSIQAPAPSPTPAPSKAVKKATNYGALAWSSLFGSWIIPEFSLPWVLIVGLAAVGSSIRARKVVRDG